MQDSLNTLKSVIGQLLPLISKYPFNVCFVISIIGIGVTILVYAIAGGENDGN